MEMFWLAIGFPLESHNSTLYASPSLRVSGDFTLKLVLSWVSMQITDINTISKIIAAAANIFTRFLAGFYQFDTNTNVCPSIHVIGSVAVMTCAWHSKHFSSKGWRIAFTATAVLISISTVFLKQHSILDVLAAIPVCLLAYYAVYGQRSRNVSSRFNCSKENV